MPLPLFVDNLETVPAEHHALYVERDGKHQLDVDLDAYVESRGTGLKSALQKERDINGMLKKHIGMKPEELYAALTNVTSDRVSTLVKQHETKHATEIAALRNENEIIRGHEHSIIREAVLAIGLTKARATEDGMKLLPDLLSNRFRVDAHEGKRSITILDEDGVTPMQIQEADGSKRAAKFGDLLAETIKAYPGQFEGRGGGSGASTTQMRTPTQKVLSRAEFQSLSAVDRADRMRTGWTLHD